MVDFAYPALKVGIEADGWRVHSGRKAWNRDAATRRRLLAAGWTIIGVSWDELERHPETVAEELHTILRQRRRLVSGSSVRF